MKKIILSLAVVMCAASVSAQNWVNQATDASKWAAGVRIGSGLQAVAEYQFRSNNYIEGRFGMSWCNSGSVLMADFTALYNWNITTMDWTPSAGEWFFDAGCGVVVGGRSHYAYFGLAGSAKLGIAFKRTPIKLSIDWTPYIGPEIAYGVKVPVVEDVYNPTIGTTVPFISGYKKTSSSSFNEYGFANFGISCVYCF